MRPTPSATSAPARSAEAGSNIAILLFDKITALDAIGPYEVLSRLPGATVQFVAAQPGPQRADTGFLSLIADYGINDVAEADVLVVPGGPGTRGMLEDAEVLEWIRTVHATSRWTTSVCTGALLLGSAGLLEGLPATTHWAASERLAEFGAKATSARIVEHGKVITAAGVSAGIDLGLHIARLVAGDEVTRAIQLVIEYDPVSRSDTGPLAKATPETVKLAREMLRSQFATPPAPANQPSTRLTSPRRSG